MRKTLLLLALAALVGCAAPSPTASPLRLPTRIPATPTPAPTPTPIPTEVSPYYEEGLAYREAGDAERALQSLTWAIQLAPDFAPAYVARGAIYLAQGKLYSALAEADAALEADPANADAHALRGEILRMQERHYLALKAFGQAVELAPSLKPETFRSRWLVARALHDSDHMLELSHEYAQANPDDPLHHYYLGWALVERGEPQAAAKALARGIEAASDPPALLWFALGWAYLEYPFWQEAITSFETTLELVKSGDTSLTAHSDQPIADLFGALGRAYLGAGRCVDAATMLDHAIAIGAPADEYTTALEEARLCQTPVPSPSPYPHYDSSKH